MIYFVRHGQTDFNLFRIEQGNLNTSLNRQGIFEAEVLAESLKDYAFDYIFSSPLNRAHQTAEIINKFHKLNINIDERLKEVSRGVLQGTPKNLRKSSRFHKDPHKYNGETRDEVKARIKTFLEDLESIKDKNILIVSHGGVFGCMMELLSDKCGLTEMVEYDIKNCELIKIDF